MGEDGVRGGRWAVEVRRGVVEAVCASLGDPLVVPRLRRLVIGARGGRAGLGVAWGG